MASQLRYDIDIMNDTVVKYGKCAENMKNMATDMKNIVEKLKEGWKGEGSDAFFQKFNDDWYVNFTHYQLVIEHMQEILSSAANGGSGTDGYQSLTDFINKLNIK